jgi:rfaE bifunctional protein nucleotidyltransferase chain/domain
MSPVYQPIKHKIQTWDEARGTVSQWKDKGQSIVFTNGCFDLIHKGHIQYLEQAAQLGDRLIVALNTDASIKRLKGESRPIKDLENRSFVMASFQFVDLVVHFEQDTPYELISSLLPNVLVKGGDWSTEQIIGADIVIQNGGEVKSLSFTEGCSTTNLINKVKKS